MMKLLPCAVVAGVVGCVVLGSAPAKAENLITEELRSTPSSQLVAEESNNPPQSATENLNRQEQLPSGRSETQVEVAQAEAETPVNAPAAKPASVRIPMMSRIFPCPSMMQ